MQHGPNLQPIPSTTWRHPHREAQRAHVPCGEVGSVWGRKGSSRHQRDGWDGKRSWQRPFCWQGRKEGCWHRQGGKKQHKSCIGGTSAMEWRWQGREKGCKNFLCHLALPAPVHPSIIHRSLVWAKGILPAGSAWRKPQAVLGESRSQKQEADSCSLQRWQLHFCLPPWALDGVQPRAVCCTEALCSSASAGAWGEGNGFPWHVCNPLLAQNLWEAVFNQDHEFIHAVRSLTGLTLITDTRISVLSLKNNIYTGWSFKSCLLLQFFFCSSQAVPPSLISITELLQGGIKIS